MSDAGSQSNPPTAPAEHRRAPPTAPTGAVYAPKRSWPMVLGILGVVFAGLSILSVFSSLLSAAMPDMSPGAPTTEAWRFVTLFNATVSLILAAMAIAGSILLMMRRPLGARALRLWAILKLIAVGVASVSVYYVTLDTMSQQIAATGMAPGDPTAGLIAAGMPIVTAFGVVLFGMPWPMFMLIWLCLPGVRDQIRAWRPSPGEGAG